MAPSDDTLEHTLVIDVEGINLMGSTVLDHEAYAKITETICILSLCHKQAHQGPLKLYIIYGEKEFTEHENILFVERMQRKLAQMAGSMTNAVWLGPGMGYDEIDWKEYNKDVLKAQQSYKNRTNELAKQSYEKWKGNVKGYNVFANLTSWKPKYESKEKRNEKIRKDFKDYILSGNPKDLPEWVLIEQYKLMPSSHLYQVCDISGKRLCPTCYKNNSEFNPAHNYQRICCACGQEGHHFHTCPSNKKGKRSRRYRVSPPTN
jgi:hypothetical protein